MCKMNNNLSNWFKPTNQYLNQSGYDHSSYQHSNPQRTAYYTDASCNPGHLYNSSENPPTGNGNIGLNEVGNNGQTITNNFLHDDATNIQDRVSHINQVCPNLNQIKRDVNVDEKTTAINELKIMVARASQKLQMVIHKKKELETEEQKLKSYIHQSKLRIEQLEAETRDPRLRNKSPNVTVGHSIFSPYLMFNQPGSATSSTTHNSFSSNPMFSQSGSTSTVNNSTNVNLDYYQTVSQEYFTVSPPVSAACLHSIAVQSSSSSSNLNSNLNHQELTPSYTTPPNDFGNYNHNSSSHQPSSHQPMTSPTSVIPQLNEFFPPAERKVSNSDIPLYTTTTTITSSTVADGSFLVKPMSSHAHSSSQNGLFIYKPSHSLSQSSKTSLKLPTVAQVTSKSIPTPPNQALSRGKQLRNLIQFKPLPLLFECFAEDIVKPEIYSFPNLKLTFSLKVPIIEWLKNPKFNKRILFRMCIIKAKKSSQSDKISRKLQIKINNKLINFGKGLAGSIKFPLDITDYCIFDTVLQHVELTWPTSETVRDYGVGIFVAKRLTVDETLSVLKTKDFIRSPEDTLKLVKKKFTNSNEICSEEILAPLTCPITKQRLEIPCIGTKCEHLCCFDAQSFLELNKVKLEWHCPSCKKLIRYNELRIDGLIYDILAKTSQNCHKIRFEQDGAWTQIMDLTYHTSIPQVIDVNKVDVITLDDSEDEKCSKEKEEDREEDGNKCDGQVGKNDYNRKVNMSDCEDDQDDKDFAAETDNTVSSSTSIMNESSNLEDSASSDSEMMHSISSKRKKTIV